MDNKIIIEKALNLVDDFRTNPGVRNYIKQGDLYEHYYPPSVLIAALLFQSKAYQDLFQRMAHISSINKAKVALKNSPELLEQFLVESGGNKFEYERKHLRNSLAEMSDFYSPEEVKKLNQYQKIPDTQQRKKLNQELVQSKIQSPSTTTAISQQSQTESPKLIMTDEEAELMNQMMGGEMAGGWEAALSSRPEKAAALQQKTEEKAPKASVLEKVQTIKEGLGQPLKNFASKAQILAKQFFSRNPFITSTLISGAIGVAVGAPFGLNGAILGGAAFSTIPGLLNHQVPQMAVRRIGSSLVKGLKGVAALSNPVGMVIMIASFKPSVIWTTGKKIGLIAVGIILFLLVLLPGGTDLMTSLAPLNPTNRATSLITPGGGYCDTSGFNILDSNAVTDDMLNNFVQQTLASGILAKGTDQERLFTQRATYIRDQARAAGLNPAIFLGFWKSESRFSDYNDSNVRPGADLGCDPTNRDLKTFEDSVLCAIGKSSISNSRTSQCAISKDANSPSCQAIQFQNVPLPISNLQDFLSSYGSLSADPNNIKSYNTVKEVITSLGLASCNINPSGNFVYYCQGDPQWSVNGDNTSMCSLGQAGCGPTSMAMVFSSFQKNITPPDMFQNFKANNWWACDEGVVGMTGILGSHWLKDSGFEALTDQNLVSGNTLDLARAQNYLNQGYLIIASHWISRKNNLSHIFVIQNVDPAAGMVLRRDPMNCSYTTGTENTNKAIMPVNDIFGLQNGPDWIYAYPIKRVQ